MTTVATDSRGGRRAAERPEPARRTVQRRAADGTVLGEVELEPTIFGLVPNVAVLHQVVTAQLAASRAGTQSTRTRAEVAGGGAKPFSQKGTGRARQGSTRAPHWSGGGVAMGPKPRSYRQRTPKKMIRLALCSALSDRASEGRVALIDSWGIEVPKTKAAVAALAALHLTGRIMVVLSDGDGAARRSFGNLQRVQVVPVSELNAYDVMRSDWVVFTDASLPGGVAQGAGAEFESVAGVVSSDEGDSSADRIEDSAASEAAGASDLEIGGSVASGTPGADEEDHA